MLPDLDLAMLQRRIGLAEQRLDLIEARQSEDRIHLEQVDTRERDGRASAGRSYLLLDQSIAELRRIIREEQARRSAEDDAQDTAIGTLQAEVRATHHLIRYGIIGGAVAIIVGGGIAVIMVWLLVQIALRV